LVYSFKPISVHCQEIISKKGIQSHGDSLTLDYVIKEVLNSYPSIKQIEEALNIADAKIALARSGYMPNFDISASYTRVDPITKITFPGFGTFQLNPENNYNAGVNYNQVIYDFGKTSKNIAYEKENKELVLKTISEAKQKLVMVILNNYYAIVYLEEAIKIKNEQLKTLNEHLDFITKKNETGSATQYEILSTNVKISNVESQKTDLETALISQASVLNSLLGNTENRINSVKQDFIVELIKIPSDSLISYALKNRDEIQISKEKSTLADMNYKIIKTQNNPVINIFANAGGKNGYIPDLNAIKANYVAGLGLRIPVFDGARNKNNLLIAKSSIQTSDLETELVRRNITNEIVESAANLKASLKKIEQNELQLSQAIKAFNLAQVSYQYGAITNLDMLDATTTVSETRLLLLKSKIDNVICNYKLKSALGIKLYQ